MTLGLFLAVSAVVFLGSVVNGLVGFGFALVAVPLLFLFLPPTTIVATALVLGLLTNGLIVIDTFKQVRWRDIAVLFPFSVLGMLFGGQLLVVFTPKALQLFASTLVLAFTGVLALVGTGMRVRRRFLTMAGAVSGLLGTSVGLDGPPVVLVYSGVSDGRGQVRSTLASYFTLTGLTGAAILAIQGIVAPSELLTALLFAPAAFCGKLLGTLLLPRVSARRFRHLVLMVMGATAVLGISSAIPWNG